MAEKIKIGVIGAGISGLSTAYWLDKAGFDVAVFESSSHLGGSIITEKQDGFLIDLGPNSTLETSTILTGLIEELNLGKEKIYGNELSNNRYVVRDGKLHPIPMSPGKFLKTDLFSLKAKLRLLAEPFIKPTSGDDISLADFVRHRLGKEFLDYAINPFVAGVYAGDPENLSTAAAFPKLYALEKKYGSFIKGTIKGARERKKRNEVAKDRAKLFSFKEGMGVFPQALAEHLGDKIQLETAVSAVLPVAGKINLKFEGKGSDKTFDAIVSAIPATPLSRMIEGFEAEGASLIKNINYPPVSVVYTGFEEKQIRRPLDGFGFLIPKVENRRILGSIWSSTIFPGRSPKGAVAFTTFVGGSRQPELAALDEDELIAMVKEDLDQLLGIKGDPILVKIKKWPRAIPQYAMGYPQIQQMFDQLEAKYPSLFFAGNYRRGISVGDSVLSAHETVEKIIKKYQAQ